MREAPNIAVAPAVNGRLFDGVRAVFFDLFDTLIEVDSSRLPEAVFGGRVVPSTAPLVHAEARKYRPDLLLEDLISEIIRQWQEVTAEKEKSWVEVSALDRFAKIVKSLNLATGEEVSCVARKLTEVHMRGITGATRQVESAAEIIQKLQKRGCGVALISNFDYAPAAQWILEATGLSGLFEKVIISETLSLRKPHERLFEEALGHFGIKAPEALHVGDTAKADVWGAGRLGIRTVWINRKKAYYPETEYPPTLTVEYLSDLKQHLA